MGTQWPIVFCDTEGKEDRGKYKRIQLISIHACTTYTRMHTRMHIQIA